MPTADLAPLGNPVAQQPTAGEGELQISSSIHRMSARPAADTGRDGNRRRPTDVQCRRLLRDRQIVRTVDHRFALNRPALQSALPKNRSQTPLMSCSNSRGQLSAVVLASRRLTYVSDGLRCCGHLLVRHILMTPCRYNAIMLWVIQILGWSAVNLSELIGRRIKLQDLHVLTTVVQAKSMESGTAP